MRSRILFILNPVAGVLKKTHLHESLQSLCNKNEWSCRIVETRGTGDSDMIGEELSDFKPDVAVACGGDGTVNLVASCLIGRDEKLCIYPLGSANGLATDFGIKGNLKQLGQIILKGKEVHMDVLLINDEHHCFHLADVGFNAKLVKNFEESGNRGLRSYLWHFLKTLFTHRPTIKAKFSLPEKEFEQSTLMITIANARKYGTGAIVNPDGRIDDGKFEICNFREYPRWDILKLCWHFFSGKLKRSDYVKIYSTDRVQIELDEKLTLQVDGEIKGESETIKVDILDRRVSVLVPPDWSPDQSNQ